MLKTCFFTVLDHMLVIFLFFFAKFAKNVKEFLVHFSHMLYTRYHRPSK